MVGRIQANPTLQGACLGRLAKFKVPQSVVFVEAPRNAPARC
jgi:hypothetical protein